MDSKRCLTPDCVSAAANPKSTYRGLCLKCYGVAKRMVEAKKTSWDRLAQLGLAAPALDPFTAAFEKLDAEKM